MVGSYSSTVIQIMVENHTNLIDQRELQGHFDLNPN